jgi:hypothetical protein
MGNKFKLSKPDLLNKLEEVKYDAEKGQDESILGGLSIAKSLPGLAGINHESEYLLLKKAAEKLLDVVPSAEETD